MRQLFTRRCRTQTPDALGHIGDERVDHARPRCSWAVSWQLNAVPDVLANCLAIHVKPGSNGPDAQSLPMQFQDRHHISQIDHRRPRQREPERDYRRRSTDEAVDHRRPRQREPERDYRRRSTDEARCYAARLILRPPGDFTSTKRGAAIRRADVAGRLLCDMKLSLIDAPSRSQLIRSTSRSGTGVFGPICTSSKSAGFTRQYARFPQFLQRHFGSKAMPYKAHRIVRLD
ncbi:hypothetical protein OKW43_006783 [Paraburkholderia sp. WC7.3g]